MPKLFMIKETYDYDEREQIAEIEEKYLDLIEKYIAKTGVYIVGKYDEMFWDEIVLSKPKEIIMDPQDGFPVILIEKLTHFGAITFEEQPDIEYYYGNSNLNIEEFAKILLLIAIKKYEEFQEKLN